MQQMVETAVEITILDEKRMFGRTVAGFQKIKSWERLISTTRTPMQMQKIEQIDPINSRLTSNKDRAVQIDADLTISDLHSKYR